MGILALSLAASEPNFTHTLVLRQSNLDQLHDLALTLNTPGSQRYGHFVDQTALERLIAPSKASVAAVAAWLRQRGIAFLVESRDTARVHVASAVPIEQLELPNDVAAVFSRPGALAHASRPSSQRKPPAAGRRVARRSRISTAPVPAGVTPAVIRATYNITSPFVNRSGTNVQGVVGFDLAEDPGFSLPMVFSKSKLRTYFERAGVGAEPGDVERVRTVHEQYNSSWETLCDDDQGPCVESQSDMEIIMGVAPGVQTEFWHFSAMSPDQQGGLTADICSDMYQYTAALLAASHPPLVNTISYGGVYCSAGQQQAVDTNLAMLAARGISMLAASGDHGPGYCNKDAPAPLGCPAALTESGVYVSWPASSPWVTAVGGTNFVTPGSVTEAVMNDCCSSSGGGFSRLYNRSLAPWQQAAVDGYLRQSATLAHFPPASSFVRSGRAVPDVAALGAPFQVIAGKGDAWEDFNGTSASSPTFAAIVSLLNEERLRAGKPPMGYLNPFLYQSADAFTDIVAGSNRINGDCCPTPYAWQYGFAAASGWDAATGLGTPKFPELLRAAMAAVEEWARP